MRYLVASYVRWPYPAPGPQTPNPPTAQIQDVLSQLANKKVDDSLTRAQVNDYCDLEGRQAWGAVSDKGGWTVGPVRVDSVDVGGGTWEPLDGISIPLQHNAIPDRVSCYLSVYPDPPDRSHRCSQSFVYDGSVEAKGIALFFTHTRTQLISAEVLAPQSGGNSSTHYDQETLLVRFFEVGIRSGQHCVVRFRFNGDPPHVRAWTWITPEGEEVREGRGFTPPPTTITNPELLAGFTRTYDEEMEERFERIQADPSARYREQKLFFYELDHQTSPSSPGLPHLLRPAVTNLGSYLSLRYRVRAEREASGSVWQPPSQEIESWRPAAISVADHLREILEQHLFQSSRPDPQHWMRLARTFEAFAGGELGVFETHGVPNGVNYFCFGELALLLEELGHDQQFWANVTPIFLRTAEIFVNAYHELGGGRYFCSYRPFHNIGGRRHYSLAMKDALKSQWDATDGKQEFARLLHAALAGEPPVSVPSKVLQDVPPAIFRPA